MIKGSPRKIFFCHELFIIALSWEDSDRDRSPGGAERCMPVGSGRVEFSFMMSQDMAEFRQPVGRYIEKDEAVIIDLCLPAVIVENLLAEIFISALRKGRNSNHDVRFNSPLCGVSMRVLSQKRREHICRRIG